MLRRPPLSLVTKHLEAVQAVDTTVLPTQNVRWGVSVLDHSCPQ